MKEINIWKGEVPAVRESVISTEKEVEFVNAKSSGIFMPCDGMIFTLENIQ